MAFTTLALLATYHPLLESGKLTLILQMGARKDNSLGDIPSVFDYAKTSDQRQSLSFLFDQLALGKPFMAPRQAVICCRMSTQELSASTERSIASSWPRSRRMRFRSFCFSCAI